MTRLAQYMSLVPTNSNPLTDINYWIPIADYTPYDPIRIWAGGSVAASAPLRITQSGAIYATNAYITGTVNANSGTIGGFSITPTRLFGGFDDSDYVGIGFANDYRIWAGNPDPALAPFSVTKTGYLLAESGKIAGFELTDDILYHGTVANDYVALGVSGDYRIWLGDPDPVYAKFTVDKTGAIKAKSGVIGGFSINDTRLFTGADANDYVGIGVSGDYRIWAGNVDPTLSPFSVTRAGYFVASSGVVGGFSLTDEKLFYGTTALDYVSFW